MKSDHSRTAHVDSILMDELFRATLEELMSGRLSVASSLQEASRR
jgi:hypothetical protein